VTGAYKWITDRSPTEYDIDIFECIAVPSPPGRKSKSISIPIQLYKEGMPWHCTTKPRKNKLRKNNANNQHNLFQRGTCLTCSYYDNYFCRRHAPVAEVLPKNWKTSDGSEWIMQWPIVAEADWCGEWEAKP
jgi:hypothetical protein